MENAITSTPTPPDTTLSVDSILYLGRNQIRRNIGKSTTLYICKSVMDRAIELAPGESILIAPDLVGPTPHKLKAISLVTSSPVTVTLTHGTSPGIVMVVNSYLFLDTPLDSMLVSNSPTATASARINLAYAY
jgi:hypothetical protein